MLKTVLFSLIALLLYSCAQEKKQEQTGTLKICFTGDLLLDRGVREVVEAKGADALFVNVKDFFSGMDAVVVNFECAATAKSSPVQKRFVFRAEPEWLKSLHNAGITHAVLANNHSYDQGREGMVETALHLQENSVIPVGYGSNQHEACEPVLIQKNGVKVAVFASVWLTLERWNYLENEPGMCQCGVEDLCKRIREYKKAHAGTYVVAVLHWGDEYNTTPVAEQRRDAGRLVDVGTDVIVGHHPHVIQAMERIKGKPVFYSLGNFVFDHRQPAASRAGIAEVTFGADTVVALQRETEIVHCVPGVIE